MLFIMIICCIGLIIRLAHVQLVKGNELTKKALNEMTHSIDIKSERGEILDRKGKKLVVNENAATVWYNPDGVSKEIPTGERYSEFDIIADGIAESLNMPIGEVRKMMDEATAMIKIKHWIPREEAIALRELNLKNVTVVDDNKRFYPYEELAADTIGFTNVDGTGMYGVEASYNFDLSGIPGKWFKQTDLMNRQMLFSRESKHEPQHGNTIVMTIDETIQQMISEEAIRGMEEFQAEAVSIIVQDPQTGFILGMANYPTFNPNNPREPRSNEERSHWATLSEEELLNTWYDIWKNYAVSNIYEPGSTFKLITAAAAIEENISNPNQHYYCSGSIRDIPEVELKCSIWPHGHGDLSLTTALEQSCNTTFITIGRNMGSRLLYKYVQAFGFGEVTGIDIAGESEGIIPENPESMLEVNLATMSYGHGIAVTPIQMINACTAVINGGNLMQPRVVKEIRDQDGNVIQEYEPQVKRRVISESTSKQVLEMMEGVVTTGTGKRAQVPGYRIGGKTGTAEKAVDGAYVQGSYVASFFGVAPLENPSFTVLVIIDNPRSGQYYGGVTAAPVAQRVMTNLLEYMEVPSAYGNVQEEEKGNAVVPYVVDLPLEDAARLLVRAGLKYEVDFSEDNDRAIVVEQSIMGGNVVEQGTVIDLTLAFPDEDQFTDDMEGEVMEQKKMPSLIGLTKDEALARLEDYGVQINVEGEGRVVEQDPGAETVIDEDTVVTIYCESENE